MANLLLLRKDALGIIPPRHPDALRLVKLPIFTLHWGLWSPRTRQARRARALRGVCCGARSRIWADVTARRGLGTNAHASQRRKGPARRVRGAPIPSADGLRHHPARRVSLGPARRRRPGVPGRATHAPSSSGRHDTSEKMSTQAVSQFSEEGEAERRHRSRDCRS